MISNEMKDGVARLIREEYKSACEQYPMFHSRHEGLAVIGEEIEEAASEFEQLTYAAEMLKDRIFHDAPSEAIQECVDHTKRGAVNAIYELIQVAAMCDKFINSMHSEARDDGVSNVVE